MFNNRSTIAPPPEDTLKEIKISPLEGEKKFLNELYEFRNFREGCDSVINCDFKSKILTNNENNFSRKELSTLVPQHLSNFSDTVFSRFTSHFSHKNKVAFTLAEVLITLGIIGVVAAITLPTLIANYKNKVLLNQAKNSYSKISNALLLVKTQNGYDSYADFFRPNTTNDELMQELSKSLKMTKICNAYRGGCWTWKTKYNKKTYCNGQTIYRDFHNYTSAILNDGSVIMLSNFNDTDKGNGGCVWFNSYPKRDSNGNIIKDENGNDIIINSKETRCGEIIIDTNGAKKPNQIGADTWSLRIYKDKITIDTFPYDDNLSYENYQEGEE